MVGYIDLLGVTRNKLSFPVKEQSCWCSVLWLQTAAFSFCACFIIVIFAFVFSTCKPKVTNVVTPGTRSPGRKMKVARGPI